VATVHAPTSAVLESTARAREAVSNRRLETRFPTDESAKMRVLRPLSGSGSEVRILDISKGGLKLQVPDPLHPGMLVQVRMKTAIALAEVRYCVPAGLGFHAGVSLQDVFWTRLPA
jgi:PilZ domain-containing protein